MALALLQRPTLKETHMLSIDRPVLRSWRKRLRLNVRPALRLRSREQICPESLRRSVRG